MTYVLNFTAKILQKQTYLSSIEERRSGGKTISLSVRLSTIQSHIFSVKEEITFGQSFCSYETKLLQNAIILKSSFMAGCLI